MSIALEYGTIIQELLYSKSFFDRVETGSLITLKASELKHPNDFTVLLVFTDQVSYIDFFFGLHGHLWNSEGVLYVPSEALKVSKQVASLYCKPKEAQFSIMVPKQKFFDEVVKRMK